MRVGTAPVAMSVSMLHTSAVEEPNVQNLRTAAEGSTAICDRMPPKSAAATSDEEDRFQTSTLLLPTAVSAIKCAVMARPFSKSVSSVIQQVGRIMRTAPGKESAVLIDHAGNFLRHGDQIMQIFEDGIHALDDGAEKPAKEKTPGAFALAVVGPGLSAGELAGYVNARVGWPNGERLHPFRVGHGDFELARL